MLDRLDPLFMNAAKILMLALIFDFFSQARETTSGFNKKKKKNLLFLYTQAEPNFLSFTFTSPSLYLVYDILNVFFNYFDKTVIH